MSTELMRVVAPVDRLQLGELLEDAGQAQLEPLGLNADLTAVKDVIGSLLKEPGLRGGRTRWDGEVMEPLHRALRGLGNRNMADMRFWQWLCICEFPDFVWARWYEGSADGPAQLDWEAERQFPYRYLGQRTLRGVSRNALARLWWCAEALWSEADGYELAREALQNQDRFQNIFEREFGLHHPAARACVYMFRGLKEDEWRALAAKLNRYATTIAIEYLGQDQIEALLS